jgi:hypothetical protein
MDDVEKLLCIQINLQILSFYSEEQNNLSLFQALEATRRLVARRLALLPGTEDFRCKPGPVQLFFLPFSQQRFRLVLMGHERADRTNLQPDPSSEADTCCCRGLGNIDYCTKGLIY